MTTPTTPEPMTAERLAEIRRDYILRERGSPHHGTPWSFVALSDCLAHIDALTARIAEQGRLLDAKITRVDVDAARARAEHAEADLAAARKPPEDGEVGKFVAGLRELASATGEFDATAEQVYMQAADLLTRLSAALKEAERKLATLRKVFAPVFKQFGPEWPDGTGLDVVTGMSADELEEDGTGACHFMLGQLRRALQQKDTA